MDFMQKSEAKFILGLGNTQLTKHVLLKVLRAAAGSHHMVFIGRWTGSVVMVVAL